MSHPELVAEVRRLRALVASYQAALASSAAAAGAAPADQSEAPSEFRAMLMGELKLRAEAFPQIIHMLRTELNTVLGVIEILMAESYGPLNARERQALELAEQSVYRLVGLFI